MDMKEIYVKGIAFTVVILFAGGIILPITQGMALEKGFKTTFKGDTLYVGGNGPGNYSIIQDAIDNATDGDTIFVYHDSSPYIENVVIDKSINLIGENTDTTIIDANGYGNVVYLSAEDVTIIGFTLRNGGTPHAGILLSPSSNNTKIRHCIITDNIYGIESGETSYGQIDECFINSNLNGVMLKYSYYWEITNCVLRNNQINLWIQNSDDNYVSNCMMSNMSGDDSATDGIYFGGGSNNVVENCSITNTCDGVSFNSAFGQISTNNIIRSCNISNNKWRGIVIGNGENNHILNTKIANNGIPDDPWDPDDWGDFGIEIFEGFYNVIECCQISNNGQGGVNIIWMGSHNYVIKSTISNNGLSSHRPNLFGVKSQSENYIYMNNFIDNKRQAFDTKSTSHWDDGELGNYWNDYSGLDINRDAIGERPYRLYEDSNRDEKPLMVPYNSNGPGVKIKTPSKDKFSYLYFRSIKLLPFPETVILGNIRVKALAYNYNEDVGIKKVEFYVDGRLRHVDRIAPYTWRWGLSSHLKHDHMLTVIAYDKNGNVGMDEQQIKRFF